MTTVNLTPGSRSIVVRPLDGENQIYDNIPSGATVRDLKERIFVAHGIQIQHQKLIYGPEILDDSRTLDSYNIREASGFVLRLLTVVHTPAPPPPPDFPEETDTDDRVLRTVFVKPASGGTVRLENVKLTMRVSDFKVLLCQRTELDPEYCRLIFSGKELEDVKSGKFPTLKDYNVQNESTIHEVMSLFGGLDVNL
ncbi:hypothetical protein GP486_000108 [Trichoglossum hirsutum]|uniref:Ubiquitin-like domain-containing protein n=1 Tax=Trichoglossum hirsutum TaxID=265104 RepID=A0A9P8RTW1_9PEZI|nr:hypothetical protein GP486_000108 [Trichoglossum hirsutum]